MKKTLLFTFGVLCGIALISSITVVFAQNDGGIIQRLLKLERETQPPIGTIVAWHKSKQGTPALPSGWVECNGKPINDSDSPYNGQNAPNLNNDGRFLRGSNESGIEQNASRVAVTLETDKHTLYFDASNRHMTTLNSDFDVLYRLGPNERGTIKKTSIDNAPGQIYAGRVRPVNMSVVWIIRIK